MFRNEGEISRNVINVQDAHGKVPPSASKDVTPHSEPQSFIKQSTDTLLKASPSGKIPLVGSKEVIRFKTMNSKLFTSELKGQKTPVILPDTEELLGVGGSAVLTGQKRATKKELSSTISGSRGFFTAGSNMKTIASPHQQGSPIGYPNRYTSLDSKYSEIVQLRNENTTLRKKIERLENELAELDHFKIALDKKTDPENFNERRVDMLKGLLQKQRQHINRLNSAIKLNKSFFKDMMNLLEYLTTIEPKVAGAIDVFQSRAVEGTQSPIKPKVIQRAASPIRKEKGREGNEPVEGSKEYVDDILRKLYMDEDVSRFCSNFNEAYAKVREIEYRNQELAKTFDVSPQKLEEGQIKYSHLLRSFVNRFRRVFPIRTVFDSMEVSEKESVNKFLSKIQSSANRIQDVFHKVHAYNLYQHNEFSVNRQKFPEFFREHGEKLRKYLDKSERKNRLILDGELLLDLESTLSYLLNILTQFHHGLLTDKSSITVDLMLQLEDSLKKSIERLLKIGVTAANETKVTAETDGLLILYKNPGKFQERVFLDAPHDDNNQYIKDTQSGIYDVYVKGDSVQESFNQVKKSLRFWVTNKLQSFDVKQLGASNIEVLNELGKDIQNCLKFLDVHEKVSAIKDVEIRFYKGYINQLASDLYTLEVFVKTKSSDIDQFFGNVHKILKGVMESFEALFERGEETNVKSKKAFVSNFRANLKEVIKLIDSVFTNNSQGTSLEVRNLQRAFIDSFKKIEHDFYFFLAKT